MTGGDPKGEIPRENGGSGVFYEPSQGVKGIKGGRGRNSFAMDSSVAPCSDPKDTGRTGLVASSSHSDNAKRGIDILILSFGLPSRGEGALGMIRNGEKHDFVL